METNRKLTNKRTKTKRTDELEKSPKQSMKP